MDAPSVVGLVDRQGVFCRSYKLYKTRSELRYRAAGISTARISYRPRERPRGSENASSTAKKGAWARVPN